MVTVPGCSGCATPVTTDIEGALRDISSHLSAGPEWALVGGLAVSARTGPRFTLDADVAVSVADDGEAEALIASLLRDGGYQVLAMIENGATGRLATARLVRPTSHDLVTDLLFASCGIEPEIAAAADVLEPVPGLTMPVAQVGHLMAMKLLAQDDERRPLDRADLLALSQVADDAAWAQARQGVVAIMERGYGRGRDLGASLETLARAVGRRLDG